MASNPFKFGKEVSGRQFYDRVEESENLHRKLSSGTSNVVMYAPRRYGKTSLVKKVLERFRKEGVATLYFDLNRVATLERFCEEYSSAICSIAGAETEWMHRASTYLSHLHPTFSFGGDSMVSVSFDFGSKMTSAHLASVLDLAEKVAVESRKGPLVVAFDEFQEVQRLSPNLPLEGIFRSCIQAHDHVRYLFFGSKTHILMRMFGEKSGPFYKSAATLRLSKPPQAESVAFLRERFASCGIGIDDELAARIVADTENIPYYLQELSSQVFETVSSAGRDWVESDDVDGGIHEIVDENSDYYGEWLRSLSPTQRSIVEALAKEPTAEFPQDYRSRHGLGVSSTVHTALKTVIDNGIVETSATGYSIGDPFFARYVLQSATEIGR